MVSAAITGKAVMGRFADVAVAGVYQTQQGDLSDRSQPSVWWEAVRGACADAGLGLGDIDGLVGDGPLDPGLRERMPAPGLAEQLGQPLRFHARSAVGAGSTAAGLNLAAYAVSHGLAEVVVIVNAVAGRGGGLCQRQPGRGGGRDGEAQRAVRIRLRHDPSVRLRGHGDAPHA